MGYQWVPWSKGQGLPPKAFWGGTDPCGWALYVGRVHIDGHLIIAKLAFDSGSNQLHCYYCYKGVEETKDQFDVMCGEGMKWVDGNGKLPIGAICIGQEGGKQMFIGQNGIYLGKVAAYDDINFKIYYPWKGQEIVLDLGNHKVLCD